MSVFTLSRFSREFVCMIKNYFYVYIYSSLSQLELCKYSAHDLALKLGIPELYTPSAKGTLTE
jgi:hypothetical protein